jgi:hypothetical protein
LLSCINNECVHLPPSCTAVNARVVSEVTFVSVL